MTLNQFDALREQYEIINISLETGYYDSGVTTIELTERGFDRLTRSLLKSEGNNYRFENVIEVLPSLDVEQLTRVRDFLAELINNLSYDNIMGLLPNKLSEVSNVQAAQIG